MAAKLKKQAPAEAYLESIGVTGVDLSVPDIDSIRVGTDSPSTVVDRDGVKPPPDLQFHLIPGDSTKKQTAIHTAKKKGYHLLPSDCGLRWLGRPEVDGDLWMVRTMAQKAAYEQSRRKKRGTTTDKTGVAKDSYLSESTTVRDDVPVTLRD